MQIRSSLLGGAAVGVLLALNLGATAEAKTKKHVSHAPAANASAEKLNYLATEVESLKARLDQEELDRSKVEAQAQAAQAEADQAKAEAQAAHAQLAEQIQVIPGEVQSAVAANKPKPSWADNTQITGTFFGNLSNISQSPGATNNSAADAVGTKANGTGFDVKRAYLGVNHQFDDTYSASLLVDFASGGNANVGGVSTTAASTFTPGAAVANTPGTLVGAEVLKNAFIQAKYDPALIIQVGEASTPWIPFAEGIYGERYVEKTLVDLNKFGNSADWGVFAHGDLASGLFSYSVAAIDGAGYKTPDRSKGMDFEGRVNAQYKGFVVAVGGYTGQEGDNIVTATPVPAGLTVYHTATRVDALAAYSNSLFHVGFEYFEASDWKVLTKAAADKSDGYSVFGTYNLTHKIAIFGRYDWGDPSQDLAPAEKNSYFNVGVSYEPVKVIDLALVYKHDAITNLAKGASFADGNTTLLNTGLTTAGSHYDEVGLFTQYKF
jgi:outer membrane murein-binding lipoprotein Lpp